MGEPGPWEQLCAEKLTGIDLATILSGLDLCGLSGPPPHTPSPRDEEVEILDGVGANDRVILNPSDSLASGAVVRIATAAKPEAAQPGKPQ